MSHGRKSYKSMQDGGAAGAMSWHGADAQRSAAPSARAAPAPSGNGGQVAALQQKIAEGKGETLVLRSGRYVTNSFARPTAHAQQAYENGDEETVQQIVSEHPLRTTRGGARDAWGRR